MIIKNQPVRANRRALKVCFVKVSSTTWDYFFDTEKKNGLHTCRVQGPNRRAFYKIDDVIVWLCEMGYYVPADFEQTDKVKNHWSDLVIKTHSLAG